MVQKLNNHCESVGKNVLLTSFYATLQATIWMSADRKRFMCFSQIAKSS